MTVSFQVFLHYYGFLAVGYELCAYIPNATRSHGTYLITSGLGSLGLEVAAYLVEQGAKRIVLVSRRALPPRTEWKSEGPLSKVTKKITALEEMGVTIHTLSVNLTTNHTATILHKKLSALSLPPHSRRHSRCWKTSSSSPQHPTPLRGYSPPKLPAPLASIRYSAAHSGLLHHVLLLWPAPGGEARLPGESPAGASVGL